MKKVMMFLKVAFLAISFMLVVNEIGTNRIVQAQDDPPGGIGVCPTNQDCTSGSSGCQCLAFDCRGCFLRNGQTGCGKCSTGS